MKQASEWQAQEQFSETAKLKTRAASAGKLPLFSAIYNPYKAVDFYKFSDIVDPPELTIECLRGF